MLSFSIAIQLSYCPFKNLLFNKVLQKWLVIIPHNINRETLGDYLYLITVHSLIINTYAIFNRIQRAFLLRQFILPDAQAKGFEEVINAYSQKVERATSPGVALLYEKVLKEINV